MRIYNTQTRTKEEFVPREEGKVAMYVCGPTVYNHIHIGNARTFTSFDFIRRYLEYRGFDVTFVQNVTDVDDKIINRANEEGRTAAEVAQEYTQAFINAMRGLNVLDPTIRPKATEEIDAMIALISRLIEKGHAYEQDGSVYFAVRSFPQYGKLSGRDIDELRSGERDLHGGNFDDEKRDPLDFAVWKNAKPDEPAWESPWGMGRPGWHIECSAMSEKYLSLPFDIHGGGADLIFPHHENEVAQSEAACECEGTTFANYWMHCGMLLIDKEKMSKSLGNFLLLKDVLEQWDANIIRMLMLQSHYRSPLDYSVERLNEAKISLERIAGAYRRLLWLIENAETSTQAIDPASYEELHALIAASDAVEPAFVEAMDDDFNTAGALGCIFTFVAAINTYLDAPISVYSAYEVTAMERAAELLKKLMGVFGVEIEGTQLEEYPQEIVELATRLAGYNGTDTHEAAQALLAKRAELRAAKDWPHADELRDELTALGFTVEDTAQGARLILKA